MQAPQGLQKIEMMKDQLLTVKFNRKISNDVYHMSLAGDCSDISRPGQFIDVLIDDFFLRRPISIYDHDDGHVEILYRAVGGGTCALAEKAPGDTISALLPLGNGFDISRRGEKTLLVAGGIGMPPVHELAKEFLRIRAGGSDADFQVLIGFRSADDMFGLEGFGMPGVELTAATEDGSYGEKGLVTDVMDMLKRGGYGIDCVMCCGPEPMLKAVYDKAAELGVASGQFSFEERMGCGFGACMGCSCVTKYGYKRICKDGPVLDMDEIVW